MIWTAMFFLALSNSAHAQTAVTTQRYNSARSGVNTSEVLLNHKSVSHQFGKLFELSVGGEVYAQPLYVSQLEISDGTKHNAVIVAAMDSYLYAFDADHPPTKKQPWLWRRHLGRSKALYHDAPIPWAGILSTPVIDLAAQVIFVNCLLDSGHGHPTYRLAKLSLKDGKTLASVEIGGSLPGTGADAVVVAGQSRIPFNASMHLQRPALLLHKGFVHLAFASHGDEGPFHGWLFSFREDDLKGGPSFLTAPEGLSAMAGAGIWQSGMGLTVDDLGYVYLATGNGDFDPAREDFGNSIMKLNFSPTSGLFNRVDTFTPFDQKELNQRDLDVGSAGVLFIPPHYLVGAGKSGKFYILDRDHLGGYTPQEKFDAGAIQVLQVTEPSADKIIDGEWMWNIHGAPVVWNSYAYVMGESDPVKSFNIDLQSGRMDAVPVSRSTFTGPVGMPGGFLTLSVNSAKPEDSAIVWVVHHLIGNAVRVDRPGRLYALNAYDLSQILWSSDAKKSDKLGTFAKFVHRRLPMEKCFRRLFQTRSSFTV